jgi:outer membrane lipoprotein-sorting protein
MKRILLAALSVLPTLPVSAQTVDEVVSRHVAALGGREKLAALQTVYMEGVSVMQNGTEVSTKTWKVKDKLMRREVDFGMGNFSMVMTDKEGWASNPRSGGAFEALPADAVSRQQTELDLAGPLVDYAAKGHKAELVGTEDVNGSPCHLVKLTLNSGKDITYSIDQKTGYILRSRTKGGGGMRGGGGGGRNPDAEVVNEFSDYRKTDDGFVFPFTVTTVGMGASMNMEKIEVNKPVDPKLYKPEKL